MSNPFAQIVSQLEVPSVIPGQTYEITPALLDVVDVDGDDITLVVQDGNNYSLSGATSILADTGFNGNLNVGVSASDGVSSSAVFMMTIGSGHPTGIEEVLELDFYPIPFSGYLRISSWENVEQLNIRNAAGQELVTYGEDDLRRTSGLIHASVLPKGVLIMSVRMNTKELLHVKVIKR